MQGRRQTHDGRLCTPAQAGAVEQRRDDGVQTRRVRTIERGVVVERGAEGITDGHLKERRRRVVSVVMGARGRGKRG
jgi:hypothetical protein